MGSSWKPGEVTQAFEVYKERAASAATEQRWDEWADLFTDDAVYVEHLYGRFEGKLAIQNWINETMNQREHVDMNSFPVDWSMIDEERGWVVFGVWNRMADPGDGTVHQAISWTLLKYAGGGKWSYEEDMYNPLEFRDMIAGYHRHKEALAAR